MRLTKSKLKQIIKEETQSILSEARPVSTEPTKQVDDDPAGCVARSDGCTASPDSGIGTGGKVVYWRDCCVEHDCCYNRGTRHPKGSAEAEKDRNMCDAMLLGCMRNKDATEEQAGLYYWAVKNWAAKYFCYADWPVDTGKRERNHCKKLA